jgi:hypothetical protein
MIWGLAASASVRSVAKRFPIAAASRARKSAALAVAQSCSGKVLIIIDCSRKSRQRNGRKALAHPKRNLPEQDVQGIKVITHDIEA